ncbi:MAG: ABC transporter ATP-binding protein [Pseudomonadota bacterium]
MGGVAKSFSDGKGGRLEALGPISFSVGRGERIGLLGPSGCGKSTALRIIAGLEAQSAGEVSFTPPPLPGDVGYVFQEPVLPPWSKILDVVALPLRLINAPREEEAHIRNSAMDALARVSLQDFAESYPSRLSGGMRMRVSLARALITDPRFLLLDEPFAALDEIIRWELNEDMLRLTEALGAATLFVTHSVFEAVFLCDRIIVMSPRPGGIVHDAPIQLPHPRTEETRRSAEYVALCAEISAALRAAMGRPKI